MATLTACFSALVASGNGQSCNTLREKLHHRLLEQDGQTGIVKSYLFKYGKEEYPAIFKSLTEEVAGIINPLILNVDPFYFADPKDIKCS